MLIKDNIMLSDIIIKKILVNIVRKYSFILVNVLLISYFYCITLFTIIISLMFSLWLLNILLMFFFMFIVNVSNKFFSVLLKIF